MMEGLADHVNEDSCMFEDVSKAIETPLYPTGARHSLLAGVLELYNLKVDDVSFDSLTKKLLEILPEWNVIPNSTYYAKKLIKPFGLEYTKIHTCPNDCVL